MSASHANQPPGGSRRRTRRRSRSSLLAQGQPMLWLMGGALAICLVMIIGLLGLVLVQGGATFWPSRIVKIETHTGQVLMGEVRRRGEYAPREDHFDALPAEAAAEARGAVADRDGVATRRMVRTGNFELDGVHFEWVSDYTVAREAEPEWAIVFERLADGRFYGLPTEFRIDGEVVATEPREIWGRFIEHHEDSRRRWRERRRIEIHEIGRHNRAEERLRLEQSAALRRHGVGSPEWEEATERYERLEASDTHARLTAEIRRLNAENDRYRLVVETAAGVEKALKLDEIVRAYPANRVGFFERMGVYFSRWWEFVSDDPREANSEGGVFPAIFGTVVMTLIMSLAVAPFGVLAALYLREYAKAGPLVSAVRIAVNNLAGVPSIVFGVFGLGFFCYLMGGGIDEVFFQEKLPSPTFGTGGILWASLTLALLTLPVVIVATEESLAAVPGSMRDGSYACGASKWQTLRRIVLPRAMPGIMTGMILAMARGAGEVAPLMLVGAVKLAPELPVDGVAPFIHPERSFMHLGFHIFDLGFQSQNSEAAKPLVFTTTLLLISLIALLNLAAVWLRSRLRRRFMTAQF